MSAATSSLFEERIDPGRLASALLAAAVHVLLFLVLVFGVRWQNRPPEAVVVELWNEPVVVAVQIPVEPKPMPKADPEPVIAKPEIVEKAPPPKPVPKVEPKPKPRDEEAQRQIRDQLLREQSSRDIDREQQQIKDLLAREAGASNSRALESWRGKIQSAIRSRINKDIAEAVPGNPPSLFVVTLLPSCEVLKITLVKSGGNKAYDDEVERAILRASPLPRPDKAEVFDRELRMTFRPKDQI